MVNVLSGLAILIAYPWLAVVPAILFFYLHSILKARVILVTAILWLAYVPYEYAMTLRLLCSGECNIRVDLILIYTLLVAMSLASAGVFAADRKKIKRRP